MIIITKYSQEEKDGKKYIRSEEVSLCPICHSVLKVIGSRERTAIEADGNKQIFVIRRLRCKDCGHVHHELPDLLVPFKRHCAETIEQVVSGGEPVSPLGKPTIRRIRNWWTEVSQYFLNILRTLEARHGVKLSASLKTSEIVRAVVNSHFWIHTRSVRMSE